jgi:hypothetical protein
MPTLPPALRRRLRDELARETLSYADRRRLDEGAFAELAADRRDALDRAIWYATFGGGLCLVNLLAVATLIGLSVFFPATFNPDVVSDAPAAFLILLSLAFGGGVQALRLGRYERQRTLFALVADAAEPTSAEPGPVESREAVAA